MCEGGSFACLQGSTGHPERDWIHVLHMPACGPPDRGLAGAPDSAAGRCRGAGFGRVQNSGEKRRAVYVSHGTEQGSRRGRREDHDAAPDPVGHARTDRRCGACPDGARRPAQPSRIGFVTMDFIALVHMVVLAVFGGLLVWAAYADFTKFVIPNVISIALLALYPVHVVTAPGQVIWQVAAVMAVVVFLVGFFMFVVGAMGGGDVKLMSVCMLWVGPIYLVEFIGVMLATSILLAVYAAVRMAIEMDDASAPVGGAAARQRGGGFKWVLNLRYVPLTKLNVPYGVAISAGGLTFLVLTVLNP
jgi:prepilin peptidase CpaA